MSIWIGKDTKLLVQGITGEFGGLWRRQGRPPPRVAVRVARAVVHRPRGPPHFEMALHC